MTHTILHGDCLDALRGMPDSSVDAICCDPPYGLSNTSPDKVTETIVRWAQGDREYVPQGKGFMGASWDAFVPPVAVWDECLRVLKPGGHLVAFAGSRTQDLMGLAIRLAGFDIRENLAWLYGSGFPKSLDVSKAVDKLDAAQERLERAREFQAFLRVHLTPKHVNDITGTDMGHHLTTHPSQPAVATADLFDKLRPHLPEVPERIEELVAQRTVESQNFKSREVVGIRKQRANGPGSGVPMNASAAEVEQITKAHTPEAEKWQGWGTALKPSHEPVILARKPLGEKTVAANTLNWGTGGLNIDKTRIGAKADPPFMYAAKAPKRERPAYTTEDGQTVQHATVKPLSVMQWLVKLVTPEGGTILDPFAGSGTTVEAAILEGFNVIGIEREAEYLPLIQQRIDRATNVLPMAS